MRGTLSGVPGADEGYDVIVVGAGTAGCVVAERLSRRPSARVLLVDAGPDGTTSPDLFTALATPGRVWPNLTAQRTPAGIRRAYPRGRGIGGSGAVNGLIALEPPATDIDRWRATGLNLGPSGYRAVMRTTIQPNLWGPADRLLALTARAHGLPLLRRAAVETPGVGPAPLHLDADANRASTDQTHLGPARTRPNLTVLADSLVKSLLIGTDGRCGGIVTADRAIEAPLTVICAGALHSPALLLRSGLTRPGIGSNLADHAAIGATLHLRHPADPSTPATCAVAHTDNKLQILPLNRLGTTPELRGLGALLVGVLASNGRGRVVLGDGPEPIVTFNLLGRAEDRRAIVRATRLLVELCTRPEVRAETHFISSDDRGTPIDALAGATTSRLLGWAEANLADYVHATGTCAYGRPDDPLAVVGPGGLVHGTPGLAVIDASVFPHPPQVNPWLATVGLATTLSEQLAEQLAADATP